MDEWFNIYWLTKIKFSNDIENSDTIPVKVILIDNNDDESLSYFIVKEYEIGSIYLTRKLCLGRNMEVSYDW